MTRIATTVLTVTLLTGCSTAKDWLQGRRIAEPRDTAIVGAPEADVYLDELAQLVSGDPAAQAEIFADAESAATLTPGPSTNLRFALVLATPGHAEANAERAQSLLREILAAEELLTPGELALARINLNNVERLLVAQAETRRLRASTSRAARTEEQAISQRLATVEAENRELRRELEDAEAKLEAITSIERSIREQE